MLMNRTLSFAGFLSLVLFLLWPGLARAGAIHDALDKEDVAGAKALLEADPALANSIDIRDRTALHHAARLGNIEIVSLLLKLGADVNAKDSDGTTPLHDAV